MKYQVVDELEERPRPRSKYAEILEAILDNRGRWVLVDTRDIGARRLRAAVYYHLPTAQTRMVDHQLAITLPNE